MYNILTKKIDRNLVNYSDWVTGLSGSSMSSFGSYWDIVSINDVVNYIGTDTDQFNNINNNIYVLSGKSGSYTHSMISKPVITPDITKSYRFSMWLNQKQKHTTDGGLMWVGSDATNMNKVTGGLSSVRFIGTFGNSVTNYTGVDEWRLFVAYIRPFGWTGTTNDGGVYNTSGGLTGSTVYDYIFNSTPSNLYFAKYLPYQSKSIFHLLYPRIDICDGNEPSLDYLLRNEGKKLELSVSSTKIVTKDSFVGNL